MIYLVDQYYYSILPIWYTTISESCQNSNCFLQRSNVPWPISIFNKFWTVYPEFNINLWSYWECFRTRCGFASRICRKVRVIESDVIKKRMYLERSKELLTMYRGLLKRWYGAVRAMKWEKPLGQLYLVRQGYLLSQKPFINTKDPWETQHEMIQNGRHKHWFTVTLSEISTERPRNTDKGRPWSTIDRSKSFRFCVNFVFVDVHRVSERLKCIDTHSIGFSLQILLPRRLNPWIHECSGNRTVSLRYFRSIQSKNWDE
jgi:hypothetical protein